MAFPWDIILGPIFKIIDKVVPDANERERQKTEIIKLQMSGELAYLDADVKLALGQMEINKEDAKGQGLLQRTWRPAAAWGCVFAGIIYPIIRALLPWCVKVAGVDGVPPLPPLDGTEAMTMLFGLLGLGGMRMAERIKGKV